MTKMQKLCDLVAEAKGKDPSARFQVVTKDGDVLSAHPDMDAALRALKREPAAWWATVADTRSFPRGAGFCR
ncbi:MAG: hypothetical protein NVS3B10_00550 [Polyangiales bacterium]